MTAKQRPPLNFLPTQPLAMISLTKTDLSIRKKDKIKLWRRDICHSGSVFGYSRFVSKYRGLVFGYSGFVNKKKK